LSVYSFHLLRYLQNKYTMFQTRTPFDKRNPTRGISTTEMFSTEIINLIYSDAYDHRVINNCMRIANYASERSPSRRVCCAFSSWSLGGTLAASRGPPLKHRCAPIEMAGNGDDVTNPVHNCYTVAFGGCYSSRARPIRNAINSMVVGSIPGSYTWYPSRVSISCISLRHDDNPTVRFAVSVVRPLASASSDRVLLL